MKTLKSELINLPLMVLKRPAGLLIASSDFYSFKKKVLKKRKLEARS